MDLPFPPFDRYRIRLRLTAGARFHFLHGGVLRGLLSRALGRHDLPPGVIPAAPESGRVEYVEGDAYQLGVTLAGDERRLGGGLFAGLVRLGCERPETGGPPPTLGGNFEVETIEPLPAVDLDAEVAALAAGDGATMEWLSPLRLRRPEEQVRRRAAYVNGDCFPADHFLERLWGRWFLCVHGRYPEMEERAGRAPLGAGVRAEPGDLPWLDLPIAGAPAKGRSYTLGGVMGRVRWRRVPAPCWPAFAVGRHLHAGAGTGYGLGRYRWLGDGVDGDEPFAPARQSWPPDGNGGLQRLRWALDALLEDSSLAYRLGLSRQGAARAERRALDDGFRWRRPADLAELLAGVEPAVVAERLRALLPLDVGGGGMPPGGVEPASALRAVVARALLPEIAAALGEGCRLLREGDRFFVLGRGRVRPVAGDGGSGTCGDLQRTDREAVAAVA